MDPLPYDFSLSVCSTLADLKNLKTLCSEDPTDELWVWKAAVAKADKKRSRISLLVCFRDGVWSYEIVKSYQSYSCTTFTFSEFENLDMEGLQLYNIRLDDSTEGRGTQSSLEEILEIVRYLRPFANVISLDLRHTSSISDQVLTHILSFYQDCGIERIHCSKESCCRAIEDFLQHQLQSNPFLKYFSVPGTFTIDCSQQLRTEVEQFAVSERARRIQPIHKHSKRFFDKLIRKPLQNRFQFSGGFLFDYNSLLNEGFLAPKKVVSYGKSLQWIRDDGVVVNTTSNSLL